MSNHIEEIVGLVVNDNALAADRIETMREIGEHISTMIDNGEYKHLCSAIDAVGHAVKRAGGVAGKDYLKACYRLLERCTKEEIDILKRKAVEVESVKAIMLATDDDRVRLISEINTGKIKPQPGKAKYGIGKGKKYARHIDHGVECDKDDGKNNPDNVVLAKPTGDFERDVELIENVLKNLKSRFGADKYVEAVRRVK